MWFDGYFFCNLIFSDFKQYWNVSFKTTVWHLFSIIDIFIIYAQKLQLFQWLFNDKKVILKNVAHFELFFKISFKFSVSCNYLYIISK